MLAARGREQSWHSGESGHLPPMCPGYDSCTHKRAEFVDSLFCSEKFFYGYSGFPGACSSSRKVSRDWLATVQVNKFLRKVHLDRLNECLVDLLLHFTR